MNGNNIIIALDGEPIAGTKSNDMKSSCGTIETASPDTGEWKTYIAGRKDWSVNTTFLVLSEAGVAALLNVGTEYTLTIESNTAGGVTHLEGRALMTACQVTATKGNIMTGSFSFVGNGELAESE